MPGNDQKQRPQRDKDRLQKPEDQRAAEIFGKALKRVAQLDPLLAADAVGHYPREAVAQRPYHDQAAHEKDDGRRARQHRNDEAGEQHHQPIVLKNAAAELFARIFLKFRIGYHK